MSKEVKLIHKTAPQTAEIFRGISLPKLGKRPMVSLCTPTYNRRPFIPYLKKCIFAQNYPMDRIEWIVVDDGQDAVGDLFEDVSFVRYFRIDDHKMTLGEKRNFMNQQAAGDILIYIDDDDYYPPERISDAVQTLRLNPRVLAAGSSELLIYFQHIDKMYKFGPYGPTHATAATFAFRRELLQYTQFNESASLAEEKSFLMDYKVPLAQLDYRKCIVVFSHSQNSFDKKELLTKNNPHVHETDLRPADIVKDPELLQFYMTGMHAQLPSYTVGDAKNKADVAAQMAEIKQNRAEMQRKHIEQAQADRKLLQTLLGGNVLSSSSTTTTAAVAAPSVINQKQTVVELSEVSRLQAEIDTLKKKNELLSTRVRELLEEVVKLKRS